MMLYSIGKDSSVLLHLALKAFAPGKLPLPAPPRRHDVEVQGDDRLPRRRAKELGSNLLVHTNQDGLARGIGPVSHGSEVHTDVMKTQACVRPSTSTSSMRPSAAPAGTRRRAAQRSASSPCARPSTAGTEAPAGRALAPVQSQEEARRVAAGLLPLSNWTELDIWLYIEQENIPIVPLYIAAPRPVVERDGQLLMVDDDRLPLNPGETPQQRVVRFRTLGCYPLTGAVESEAASLRRSSPRRSPPAPRSGRAA